MPHSKGLHHYHLRKRKEPFPNSNKLKRFMDKAVIAVGIISFLFTIPQVTKIWVGKDAAGVSLISWVTFTIAAVFWLIYGILHKEKPIIITYAGWIIIDFIIVLGILIY